MVIQREKGMCRESRNLLIKVDAYDTVRSRTFLPLNQTNTFEREMKIQRMVRINNTTVEEDGCRLNA